MLLTSSTRPLAHWTESVTNSRCKRDSPSLSSPRSRDRVPMIPFMGVQISWLMFARNSDLIRFVLSSVSFSRVSTVCNEESSACLRRVISCTVTQRPCTRSCAVLARTRSRNQRSWLGDSGECTSTSRSRSSLASTALHSLRTASKPGGNESSARGRCKSVTLMFGHTARIAGVKARMFKCTSRKMIPMLVAAMRFDMSTCSACSSATFL
mmetsp:Transcript_14123/g.32956  ORF Transcript_14123/g.32956 Transcript_14123/m.32956 type:complete len:210 (+) Transcript_14123:1806-2435(+)